MLHEHTDSVFYKGYRRQLMATLTVNIITLCHGIAIGWVAPTLLKLRSADSPLTLNISVEQISWIGALIGIGAMIGNPIYGFLLQRIGRKITIYLLAIPHMCSWVTVLLTCNVTHLYIARTLTGMTGGGVFLVIPIFVSEIANCQVRGALGSIFMFSLNSGILAGFIIASHVHFYIIPCVIIVLPILYLLLWMRFPETPQYLLRKSFYEEAEESMKFYRNYKESTTEAFQEFNTEFNDLKMSIESTKNQQTGTLRDLCNKRSIKALLVGVTLIFVNVGSGTFTILNYLSMIFAEADEETANNFRIVQLSAIFLEPILKWGPQSKIFSPDKVDPNTNSIITGVVQIAGSFCASILIDKLGRKILLMVSSAGMCLGLTTLGLYSYLVCNNKISNITFLPVVLLSFVIFAGNIGVVTVTFVTVVEILPPKIRSFGTTFCMFQLNLFSFLLLKIFPNLMDAFNLSGVMWLCASIAGCGFIFFLIYLRETMGMPLENDSNYK